METLKKLPLFVLVTVFMIFETSPAFPFSGSVNVLLNGKLQSGHLSGIDMTITDATGKSINISGAFTAEATGTDVIIGRSEYEMPLTISSAAPVEWDGIKYYGEITIKESKSKGYLSVGNKVDIELYLRGVIGYEMDPCWNIEALKAQTVVARTYAAHTAGKHGEYGLCATNHCQLYKGTKAESKKVDEAIKATEGLILRWKSAPAAVFYHSDSGGMVTGAGSVWGSDIPYLCPKPDPVISDSPNSEWQVSLSMDYIESKMAENGINLGKIDSLKPLDRDQSGRVLSIEINGAMGKKSISGYKFRSIMGTDKIKSTLFEIGSRTPMNLPKQALSSDVAVQDHQDIIADSSKNEIASPSGIPEDKEEKLVWMTKNKIFTVNELMEMLSKPDYIDLYLEKGTARMEGHLPLPVDTQNKKAPEKNAAAVCNSQTAAGSGYQTKLSMSAGTGPVIVFFGRGSGHGVGLSQYGAKALAEKMGWDYTQILSYYFPGTILSQ